MKKKISDLTREELAAIVEKVQFALYAVATYSADGDTVELDPDAEGDSETLGVLYEIMADAGLKPDPTGPFDIVNDLGEVEVSADSFADAEALARSAVDEELRVLYLHPSGQSGDDTEPGHPVRPSVDAVKSAVQSAELTLNEAMRLLGVSQEQLDVILHGSGE